MASQADISSALQQAGVTVYGLQVANNSVSGTVGSDAERQKVYETVSRLDNALNLNITVNAGFATQEANSAATGGKTYTVKPGDSLSKVAKEQYGDASQWKKIYEANRDTIGSNPDLIQAGVQLTIPA